MQRRMKNKRVAKCCSQSNNRLIQRIVLKDDICILHESQLQRSSTACLVAAIVYLCMQVQVWEVTGENHPQSADLHGHQYIGIALLSFLLQLCFNRQVHTSSSLPQKHKLASWYCQFRRHVIQITRRKHDADQLWWFNLEQLICVQVCKTFVKM